MPADAAALDTAPHDTAPAGAAPALPRPVLAVVDDSALAVPVVLRAARLAATAGQPLIVATVFTFPVQAPAGGLPATCEAFEEAVAVFERVRPLLDRLAVPYRFDIRGCPGRGGPRRRARRVADQLLRIRAETAASAIVLGLPDRPAGWRGAHPGAEGRAGRCAHRVRPVPQRRTGGRRGPQ